MIILEKSEFSALRNENEVGSGQQGPGGFSVWLTFVLFFCLEIEHGNKDNEAESERFDSQAERRIHAGP